ncbi:MAG: Trk system potassium transporter TrkA [Clostridia bacterium]|nr:Trk system potassium transporter TrkA [Clostridia bacterium]MBR3552527.1 Trk system potassium transporter TrkA [Clostridia bacterium]
MNIIIIGCGKVGATLAEQLTNEGHDITVVDVDPDAVKRVTSICDVMGIVGNGVAHRVQKEAGIDYADLLIAMTGSDEQNLLSCLIAKKASSCITIARVRNPDYITERSFIKEKLGISMIVNPELEAANEITRLFSIPSAIEVDTFARGRIELMKTILPRHSPIAGMTIKNALGKLSGRILICVIERGSEVIIPSGDTMLCAGDAISFVTTRKDAASFFKKAGLPSSHISSVVIVGGGKISFYLAQKLSEIGFHVKIIEKDKEHCEFLTTILPNDVVIINGDGSDQNLLLEEGVDTADGFASITDIDEENVMLSLFVRSNFTAKTVTKVNKLNFEGIIDKLDIGSVIYPKYITAEMIVSYVRALENTTGSNVQTLYNIVGGKVQALEFNVRSQSAVVGVPLSALRLKPGLLLCCISRHGQIIIPGGSDCVELGDTVVVVTTSKSLNDLKDILA